MNLDSLLTLFVTGRSRLGAFVRCALAIAIVLAMNAFASAQCNAGRQIDTTNLQLGLQAAPVQAAPQLACANGQCNAQVQSFSAPAPQTSVLVNTPRVAVNVGVQRAYQPLYVVTAPQAIVSAPVQTYSLVSAPIVSAPATATATATAGVQADVQALAFDPGVGVQVANVCAGGNCGRAGLLRSIFRPRRSVSVARSRSVTFN